VALRRAGDDEDGPPRALRLGQATLPRAKPSDFAHSRFRSSGRGNRDGPEIYSKQAGEKKGDEFHFDTSCYPDDFRTRQVTFIVTKQGSPNVLLVELIQKSPKTHKIIMKTKTLIPAILGGLILIPTAAQAQPREPGEGGGGDARATIREQMLKKFDKNGDGKLDEKERPSREQLQEFFRAQQGGAGGKDRAPGGGRPGAGGRPGQGGPGGRGGDAGGNMRELFLKKFDKNGDGKLDEKERPSREQAMEFLRGQGGGGRPGQGERPGEGGRPGAGGQGGRPDFGGGRPGQGGQGGQGGRPMNPVMVALDANKDGEISAAELKNATAALSKLDKNKDGKLTREEMRPSFDRGNLGGQRPGGDRPDRPRPGGLDRRPREGQPGQRPDKDRPTRPERPTDRRSDA